MDHAPMLPRPEIETPQHEPEGNPVAPVLSAIDYAQLGADAVYDGGTAAQSLPGMFETMGEDAAKIWQGGPSVGALMKGVSAITAPLGIVGGVMDVQEGREMMRRGDTTGGMLKEGEGVLSAGGGALDLVGLASGTGATLGPLASSLATGLAIGHYGDEQAKAQGVYHDNHGAAESASDWAAEQGTNADAWVSEHSGSRILGGIAGGAVTAADSVVGAARSTEAAIDGAANKVLSWL